MLQINLITQTVTKSRDPFSFWNLAHSCTSE